MSFTAEVKEQLLRINTSKRCCREAEFLAFLRMSGNISLAAGGQAGILAASGNAAIARRYFKLVKELWQLRAEILMRDSQHFKKSRIYTLRIPPQEGVQRILLRMGGIPDGAFLGNGFVSDPKRSYHLEIVCQDMTQAHFLLALAAEYALTFKLAERKGRFLTYCKDSAQISDFLNVIGAHGALLQLENVKIIKDTSNNVNRVINCDTANTDKTIDAAQRQVQAIRRLADSPQGLAGLSPSLRETAALRLENPELSLLELARLFAKPISKAGLYHRLQKLEKLAEDL